MKGLGLPAERSACGMPDAPVATAHADAFGVFGVSMGAAFGTAYKVPAALCPELFGGICCHVLLVISAFSTQVNRWPWLCSGWACA